MSEISLAWAFRTGLLEFMCHNQNYLEPTWRIKRGLDKLFSAKHRVDPLDWVSAHVRIGDILALEDEELVGQPGFGPASLQDLRFRVSRKFHRVTGRHVPDEITHSWLGHMRQIRFGLVYSVELRAAFDDIVAGRATLEEVQRNHFAYVLRQLDASQWEERFKPDLVHMSEMTREELIEEIEALRLTLGGLEAMFAHRIKGLEEWLA